MNTAVKKSYWKAPTDAAAKIISAEKQIAKNLNVDNRIDALAAKSAFITLKDHKPNFANNPTCRLINPSKSEIGIVSKKIRQNRFNNSNTDSVLAWFNKIPNKLSYSCITFDIIDFYPSISEDLLIEALTFAAQFDEITDEEKTIIIQAKNSLLFDQNVAGCKKESNSLFDVTMGSFDGAETCELAGSYLLSILSPLLGNAVGLCRDDGLAALNKTPREIKNIKKQVCTAFNDHNLRLTIEVKKKRVDYLDITLDLITASYKPFNKPGNEIQYINRYSNHPPAIFRIIPDAIKNRLFKISSGEQAFNSAAPHTRKP